MRRPSAKQRRRFARLCRKRALRAQRRRRKRAGHLRQVGRHERRERCFLLAPEHFATYRDTERSKLVRFLERLRQFVLLQGKRVHIDFSRTRKMQATGTVLFAAELQRINHLVGPGRVTCGVPVDHVVAQVLQHVGVFRLLGQRRTCKVTADNVRYWKVHSGTVVNMELAAAAFEEYSRHFSDPQSQSLYDGLSEAMLNCRHHAYEEERGDGFPNLENWWMFAQCKDERLMVAVCDLGIGIPRSLRRKPSDVQEWLKQVLTKLALQDHDAALVRAALEYGKSRTGLPHRGKGFGNMRAVLDHLDGKLHIHSNRGVYMYDSDGQKENVWNSKASILGTIIVWDIALAKATP